MLAAHFGEHVASRYDEMSADMFDLRSSSRPLISSPHSPATGGPRIRHRHGPARRSPLAQRGVRVHGIDLLTLRERWSGWQREAFTAESTKHVSVWGEAAHLTR